MRIRIVRRRLLTVASTICLTQTKLMNRATFGVTKTILPQKLPICFDVRMRFIWAATLIRNPAQVRKILRTFLNSYSYVASLEWVASLRCLHLFDTSNTI